LHAISNFRTLLDGWKILVHPAYNITLSQYHNLKTMGNCIKHPQIHEDVYPTPTGSAEPPRFDAKSVETHATHVELHNEEGELSTTSFPSDDDENENSDTKDAPSTAAPLMPPDVDSIEKQKPLPKDDSRGRSKALILLAVCAVAAALAAGSIVVTRQPVKGGGHSHLLQDTDGNVDPDVSPRFSFWQEIQNRKDECLLYPHKIMEQHVLTILNESESDVLSSPSNSGCCSWNTQWESKSNDLTSNVHCNSHGIVQEWTTSIRNRTVSYLNSYLK
jgi:hypothetical protein